MVVVEQDRELALTNRGNAVTRARESASARAGMPARLRREAFLRTFRHGKRLGQTYRQVSALPLSPLCHLTLIFFCDRWGRAIAQQNAETIKNLRMGMLASLALSLLLRILFRRSALRPTTFAFWVYALSLVPSVFLSRYLERIGSPRRDPTTGALISAGEDLARPGIIEWCFDVVYITWACQIGSGAFGQWVWWLYLVVSARLPFRVSPRYWLWGYVRLTRGSCASPLP